MSNIQLESDQKPVTPNQQITGQQKTSVVLTLQTYSMGGRVQ